MPSVGEKTSPTTERGRMENCTLYLSLGTKLRSRSTNTSLARIEFRILSQIPHKISGASLRENWLAFSISGSEEEKEDNARSARNTSESSELIGAW